MQPRVTQVGPLIAATATKIGLAQTPVAAGGLALNGAAGFAVANNISLSQSGIAATPLVLNGALVQTKYSAPTMNAAAVLLAALPYVQPIYITSAGDDHLHTFVITGLDINNAILSETITGTNAGVSASVNAYKAILSIVPSANTTSTVTVGAVGYAMLDTARRVLFTSSGTDTGVTITIAGTDWAGNVIGETLLGGSSGSPVYTVLDYLKVTSVQVSGATAGTISVGTNGVASSPWINLDPWAIGSSAGQCVASGTVNFTVQVSNDDPDSYANPVSRSAVAWDSIFAGMIGAAASGSFALAVTPSWTRVLLNSNTNPGYVRMTIAQNSAATL